MFIEDISSVSDYFKPMAIVPFLSYKILPSQTIIKEHLRPDHVSAQKIFETTKIMQMTHLDQRRYQWIDPWIKSNSIYY